MDHPTDLPAQLDSLHWRALAWWRTGLAVLACIGAAVPMLRQAHEEFRGVPTLAWLYLVWPYLIYLTRSRPAWLCFAGFALLSAFIARRAFRRRPGALYLALPQDVILLAVVVWATQSILHNPWGYDHPRIVREIAPWLTAGIAFGAEAAYLLRTAGRWRFAWLAFAIFVAAAAVAVAIVPPAITARRLAHVRPLLRYANTHWFAVPLDAKIAIGQSPDGPRHMDSITVMGKHSCWAVRATHDEPGRWMRADREGAPSAYPAPYSALLRRKERRPHANTPGDALRLLTICGVPDHALRFEAAVADPDTKDITLYRFRSPLTHGTYEVYPSGYVRCLWDQPLDLP